MPIYRANYHSKRGQGQSGRWTAQFAAADDATATAIAGLITAAVSARMTTLTRVHRIATDYGQPHPEGTRNTVRFGWHGGQFQRNSTLRNIVGATKADAEAAAAVFTAAAEGHCSVPGLTGVVTDYISAAIRRLPGAGA